MEFKTVLYTDITPKFPQNYLWKLQDIVQERGTDQQWEILDLGYDWRGEYMVSLRQLNIDELIDPVYIGFYI